MTQGHGSVLRRIAPLLFLLLVGALALSVLPGESFARQVPDSPAPSAAPAGTPALTTDEIVSRLEQKNRERRAALRQYHSLRHYNVRYTGFFGSFAAQADVEYRYSAPNTMEFKVVSQSGSKFVLDHVILKLLEAETEAATEENRRRTALSADNYNFTLAGYDTIDGSPQYILSVSPKNDNKFLYRGKIWVDAADFAVTRINAEPSKSPSLWIKGTQVRHRYQKVAGFWLPAENQSESEMRMGGRALLSIEYKDYSIMEPAQFSAQAAGADARSERPSE